MAERASKNKEGKSERTLRWLRNINALGALALFGAAELFAPLAAPLAALAGVNAAQAGGLEIMRRSAKKRRHRKETR